MFLNVVITPVAKQKRKRKKREGEELNKRDVWFIFLLIQRIQLYSESFIYFIYHSQFQGLEMISAYGNCLIAYFVWWYKIVIIFARMTYNVFICMWKHEEEKKITYGYKLYEQDTDLAAAP